MKFALLGNPNCGKTTLFNRLTGARGKVGNMPGVTVDSSKATVRFEREVELVDLPGTYSLHANAPDERITQEVLLNADHPDHPDVVLCVVEAAQLRSSLFLVSQILDWGFKAVLVINETDRSDYQTQPLEKGMGIPVLTINAVTGDVRGFWTVLRSLEARSLAQPFIALESGSDWEEGIGQLMAHSPHLSRGQAIHLLRRGEAPNGWDESGKNALAEAKKTLRDAQGSVPSSAALQLSEAGMRMERLRPILKSALGDKSNEPDPEEAAKSLLTNQVDAILTHPFWGNIILGAVFFGIFQAVYAWSALPMEWVDGAFSSLINRLNSLLPESWWSSLLVDGLLSGIAGIVVFVPQIMILFGLTTALESTGYMARVGFLGDRFLQRIGLNGRSIVPLVGGLACAVPAVMAARSIPGRRERLLTILITPLMTCSARLPVYAFLIGFVVPNEQVFGVFNQQGLFLFGIYITSTLAALALAWIMHRALPRRTEGGFTLEWPVYRWPNARQVGQEMLSKGWTFISSAGQVIIVVSMVLWGLARFGPTDAMNEAREAPENQRESALLEASYVGHLGRWVEPIFRPLGYDGRMGIAILTSFAAREVFVGTLSTLYPHDDAHSGNIDSLKTHLGEVINPHTGKPLLNSASALSLMLFYMFAMQCMSTVAVVQRELKSWFWAIAQAIGFSLIAYGMALLAFQIFG